MVAVEVKTVGRSVIEDSIEDKPHSAPVHFLLQRSECGIAAERGVDVQIIVGIVTVVGARLEYRRQVEGVDAQGLRVVQLVLDTLEIATEKLVEVVEAGG